MLKIVHLLLQILRIKFNKQTVNKYFKTHPYNHSILFISDLLDEFSIENVVVKISSEKLSKIPTPFIAKTQSSQGDYCLVLEIDDNNLTYQDEKGEINTESVENFFKQYSGVVLVAEANEKSTEPNYKGNKRIYKNESLKIIIYLVVLFSITFFLLLFNQKNNQLLLVYFIKMIGLSISILLLMQNFNVNNPYISKLCSNATGNGCDNILNSPAAKIFNGLLSWSEVGFFYFAATVIIISIKPTAEIVNLLWFSSLVALPYTFYSIIYQWRIAKQWCKLCLTIQILLWLEFAITTSLFTSIYSISAFIIPVSVFIASFVFVISSWFVIKPIIIKSLLVEKLQRDLNQFKKDETIFQILLDHQRSVSELSEDHKIIFGNPKAKFEITFVSSPFCRPCAEMYTKIKYLLDTERENIKINHIYAASIDPSDPKNFIISSLIKLYQDNDQFITERAMQEWYMSGINNSAQWKELYAFSGRDKITEETMVQHRLWCEINGITHTPALFINNRQYLSEYSLDDIRYFIQKSSKPKYA